MLDDLVNIIQTLQTRISSHDATLRENETRTRMTLIDPLLQVLGWDTADPSLVTPEYRVDVGWADYALRSAGNKPAAVIEAKRLGSFVENHLEQAVGYCIQQGIAYAGVTDGSHWQLYRTFEPVPLVEKLVLDVSITSAPAHEAALKLLLLWRPNLQSGQPVEASESIFSPTKSPAPSGSGSIKSPTNSPSSQGWISLTSIETRSNEIVGKPRGLTPSEFRLPNGDEKQIKEWWHILREVAEYLISMGKLTPIECLIREGQRAYFIRSERQPDKAGNFGHLHQLSNGLFLTRTNTGAGLVNNAQFLMKRFGEDVAAVQVKFS